MLQLTGWISGHTSLLGKVSASYLSADGMAIKTYGAFIMSIEKFSPRITGEVIPYTQVNTHVVQNITDPIALAIWVYLLTLPPSWNVVKEYLEKHFKIGQDRIKKTFAYLHRCGLIEYVRGRNENGRLQKVEIRVLNGSKFLNNIENKKLSTEIATTGVKTTPVVNHTCGKQPPINNIYNKINNIKKTKHRDRVENFELPNGLSPELWSEYEAHRKAIKKPLSPQAKKLAINKLKKMQCEGIDIVEVINESILNGWAGLFTSRNAKVNSGSTISRQPMPTQRVEQKSTVRDYREVLAENEKRDREYHDTMKNYFDAEEKRRKEKLSDLKAVAGQTLADELARSKMMETIRARKQPERTPQQALELFRQQLQQKDLLNAKAICQETTMPE